MKALTLTIHTKNSSSVSLMEILVSKTSYIPDSIIKKIASDVSLKKITWTTMRRSYEIDPLIYKKGKFSNL